MTTAEALTFLNCHFRNERVSGGFELPQSIDGIGYRIQLGEHDFCALLVRRQDYRNMSAEGLARFVSEQIAREVNIATGVVEEP